MFEVHTISFQTFFVWACKIVVDSGKFTMLLLYIVWDNWLIFIIWGSKQQLQQQLKYTILKPDCHSRWISKLQSDSLQERYAIKFCFKLGKHATKKTCFCMNRAAWEIQGRQGAAWEIQGRQRVCERLWEVWQE